MVHDEKPSGKIKAGSPYNSRKSLEKSQVSLKEAAKLGQLSVSKNGSKLIKIKDDNIEQQVPQNLLQEGKSRPLSRDDRAKRKFSHHIYDKAACMFEHLCGNEKGVLTADSLPEFDSEFERRRAYSLAFSAKRYEAVLKDVLLDSAFYSSYFKLETFHHAKVMVMLLDFYEHNFRFSDSHRDKPGSKQDITLSYISEIQKAFFDHKVKLCSAFARNRIKACALTLEGLLPPEVKERGECGARHPLYARINTDKCNGENVIKELTSSGFEMKKTLGKPSDDDMKVLAYCTDNWFENLLAFPTESKDEIFNHSLTLDYILIPQSKPCFILGEIVRRLLQSIDRAQQKALELIHVNVYKEDGDILITHPDSGALSSHINSFLGENRKLIICGCNGRKYDDLMKLYNDMAVYHIEVIQENFLELSPNDERLRSCKFVICNPPCSKSGVVNPVDYVLYEGASAAASLSKVISASKLRGFVQEQYLTLEHALKFVLVQTVIYFNSSTNIEENQSLITQILNEQRDNKNDSLFAASPIPQELLNYLENEVGALNTDKSYISVSPNSVTDGFFLASLTRKVRQESVRDVMNRAAKKGFVKKAASSAKSATKKKKAASAPQPSTARLSTTAASKATEETHSSNIQREDDEKDETENEDPKKGRAFKF